MRAVHLHGELGERFGEVYDLDVASAAEAVRALCSQLRGFEQAVRLGEFRVRLGDYYLDEDTLDLRSSHSRAIHVIPMPVGSKNKGLGKIIIGLVIIAASVATAGLAAPAFAGGAGFAAGAAGLGASLGASTGILGITFGQIALFGASLVLGGAAQMLSPTPKTGDYGQRDAPDQRASFLINSPINSSVQGSVVPLVFGEVVTGSVVGSAGLAIEQIPFGADDGVDVPAESATNESASADTGPILDEEGNRIETEDQDRDFNKGARGHVVHEGSNFDRLGGHE